jgi:hypothetical protein
MISFRSRQSSEAKIRYGNGGFGNTRFVMISISNVMRITSTGTRSSMNMSLAPGTGLIQPFIGLLTMEFIYPNGDGVAKMWRVNLANNGAIDEADCTLRN